MSKKVLIIASVAVLCIVVVAVYVLTKEDSTDEEMTVTFTSGETDTSENSEVEEDTNIEETEEDEEDSRPRDANGNIIYRSEVNNESDYIDNSGYVPDEEVTGGISSEDYDKLQNITDEQRRLSEEIFENEEGAAPY